MDVHQLELFLAVMESSSMTRAAEKIHLSPGAVSLQLHNLAMELNTELFVRSGKRLVPQPTATPLPHLAHLFDYRLFVFSPTRGRRCADQPVSRVNGQFGGQVPCQVGELA